MSQSHILTRGGLGGSKLSGMQVNAETAQENWAKSQQNISSVPEIPRMQSILGQFYDRIEVAAKIRDRLESAMNYVCGHLPSPVEGNPAGATAQHSQDAFLEALEIQASSFYHLLDSIDDQVRRLERVIG